MHNLKASAVAVLMLTTSLASAWARPSMPPRPDQNTTGEWTLTGIVGDSKCKGGVDRKNMAPLSCAYQCTHSEGRDYVLVTHDAVYVLNGHEKDLDKFAGGRATITGHITGNTVQVDSVSSAKKHA